MFGEARAPIYPLCRRLVILCRNKANAGTYHTVYRLEAMLINVSVWLILFLASTGKMEYDKKKLKNLKHSGVCMDSEIEDMIPAAWIRVGNYTSCRIICRFIYERREYKAASNYYVLTPFKRKKIFMRMFIQVSLKIIYLSKTAVVRTLFPQRQFSFTLFSLSDRQRRIFRQSLARGRKW